MLAAAARADQRLMASVAGGGLPFLGDLGVEGIQGTNDDFFGENPGNDADHGLPVVLPDTRVANRGVANRLTALSTGCSLSAWPRVPSVLMELSRFRTTIMEMMTPPGFSQVRSITSLRVGRW